MSISSALGNVILPATYHNVTLNRQVNSSTGGSGVYAAEHFSANAIYQIEIGISGGRTYSEHRDDLITLEAAMKNGTEFDYSYSYPGVTTYQGDVTDTNNITFTSGVVGESTVYVNTTTVTSISSGTLFKAGDWIEAGEFISGIGYQTHQVAEDVAFSSSSNIAVPITRPLMSGLANTAIITANHNPSFKVKFAEYNPYTIQPHDRIQYKNASIKLIEVI